MGSKLEPVLYDTSHTNRGIAIVINDDVNRKGSEIDVEKARETFKKLNFKVREFLNYDDITLQVELRKIAEEDHTNSDCLVVVAMAHGYNDRINLQGYDMSISDLWQPFVGNKCPSLVGKPKLIFIQSCRGSKFDIGTNDSLPVNLDAAKVTIPMQADLLVMLSTYDEHISMRPVTGSWFIQSLCDVLQMDIAEKELLALLTHVSYRVSRKSWVIDDKQIEQQVIKQIPSVNSMLTKEFYFVPK